MSVILTGNSGMVSKRLSKYLQCRGFDVTVTSRDGSTGLSLDLENVANFDDARLKADDVVIFLAAISSPDVCEKNFEYAKKINLDGTKDFIEKCLIKGVKVIFFSSDTVYGESVDGQIFNEDSVCNPKGRYAQMKLEVEESYKSEENFKALRLSYIFSREDKVTTYLKKSSDSRTVAEIFKPYSRNIIYIEDVNESVEKMIVNFRQLSFQHINLCGKKPITRENLAEYYKKYADNSLEFKTVYPGDDFYTYRAKDLLTESKYLKHLLGREQVDIEKAMQLEFGFSN